MNTLKLIAISVLTAGLVGVSISGAQAKITKAPSNVDVVVSSSTTKFSLPVTSNSISSGEHTYFADIWQDVNGIFIFTGEKISTRPSFVIPASLSSKRLTPGNDNPFVVVDEVDGKSRAFNLTVRRKGKLGFKPPTVSGSRVSVRFAQSHYDIPTGTYKPDNKTPIYLQRFDTTQQAWVNVGKPMTTNRLGVATGKFLLPIGQSALRGRRPLGATVTASTSRMDEVCVGRC